MNLKLSDLILGKICV